MRTNRMKLFKLCSCMLLLFFTVTVPSFFVPVYSQSGDIQVSWSDRFLPGDGGLSVSVKGTAKGCTFCLQT